MGHTDLVIFRGYGRDQTPPALSSDRDESARASRHVFCGAGGGARLDRGDGRPRRYAQIHAGAIRQGCSWRRASPTPRPRELEQIYAVGHRIRQSLRGKHRLRRWAGCAYDHEADAIRETFGRFVLVKTNFGRPNPFRPADDPVARLIARGMIAEGTEADFIRRHLNFKRWQMQGLQDLLRDLATSGSAEKIVIRPHPVENHDVWREWGRPLIIEARYEGSANNWMMAADAVIHPGCTTGIEGLPLDRAVFSCVPDADSEFIGEQDRASEWVTNAAELSNGLARVRGLDQQDVRRGLAPQRERLSKSIVNVEPPYAPDRILDKVEQLDLRPVRPAELGIGDGFLSRLLRADRRTPKKDERSIQKFPGVAEEEIVAPLAQWAEASILTQVPQITRFHDRLWVLH